MTYRTPEQRLADEAGRRRKQLQEERASHELTRSVLRDVQRQAVRLALRHVLKDPRDFDVYIGVAQVVDDMGHIEWARVASLVDRLLSDRPHLGAPNARALALSAVNYVSTGTAESAVPDHGALWATRGGPGAGEEHFAKETP